MNINNTPKNNDWSPIKNLLKEKYSSGSNSASVNNISGNDPWEKFQQITGKTKEQIQTKLNNF